MGNLWAGRRPARFTAAILMLVLLASLVLAACGDKEEDPAGNANDAAATTAASPTSEQAASTTEATSETDTKADTNGTRTVNSAFGEIEVPTNPQRVVTLGDYPLDAAVALGANPIGAVSSRGTDGVAAYVQGKVEGISIVGTTAEPNLEAIVKVSPDLILATRNLDQAVYDKLSKIAPTYAPPKPDASNTSWSADTLGYADALGKTAEAEQALKDIDERIAKLQESLGITADTSAVVMRWMAQGPVVMSSNLITGQILTQLGFTLPEFATKIEGGHSDVLSLENLTEVDTDWIFIATLNAEGDDALKAARSQPAFTRLKADAAGHVVAVNGQLWSSTSGPLAANAILDDIEKAFASGS